jgi:hypothetical protein
MRLLSIVLLFFLFNCFSFLSYAQGEAANWFFGQNAGLHFNSDSTVTSLSGSAMDTPEGCATISDKNGNLLFYTNGETVWNRQHQIMANGSGLLGYKAGSQTCLIIPHPGNATLYYIFHLQAEPNKMVYNLRYSLVDMAAQNGLGEVLPNAKNALLAGFPNNQFIDYFSEKMTAVRHANNRDVWLITHRPPNTNTNEFRSYKITPDSGLITTPVVSQIFGVGRNPKGLLKASPNGRWLVGFFGGSSALFSYNNKTGVVSPMYTGFGSSNHYNNGVEFSPQGDIVYINHHGLEICQYDLSSKDARTISKSVRVIFQPYTYVWPDSVMSNMQLAENGKIYISRKNTPFLYEIADPNAPDTACHFRKGPNLALGSLAKYGLPNFIQSYFAPPRFTFTTVCSGSARPFSIPDLQDVDSVRWDFGDPASGNLNTSRSTQPLHVYAKGGNYPVKLTVFTLGEAPVFEKQVTVLAAPQVKIGENRILCEGAEITLNNQAGAKLQSEKYRWSTGDTTATITVKASGTYWLEISNITCTTRDSVTVTFKPCPPPSIPNIITLNHDGKNETFSPQHLPAGDWHLRIFSRWGTLIYGTENYKNDWPQMEISGGTYYYLLRNPATGQKFKGWLEVVK